FDQHVGLASGPGLADHLRSLRADPRQRLPAVGLAVALPLRVVEPFDDVRGVAVGHHPPRVLARPVFVVGDLSQRGHWIHLSSVPRPAVGLSQNCPTMKPASSTPKPPISPTISNT